jgi:hypothetical protein
MGISRLSEQLNIAAQRQRFLSGGLPVISVDTERAGPF